MNDNQYRTACAIFIAMIVAYMTGVAIIEIRKGNIDLNLTDPTIDLPYKDKDKHID